MVDLDELVAQVRSRRPAGNAAPQPQRRRATGPADIAALVAGLRTPQAPTTPRAPIIPEFGGGSNDPANKPNSGPKEDSGLIGSIVEGAKNTALKAIDIVDTPRAAVVSGINELSEVIDNRGGANWDEWWSQTANNIGSREGLGLDDSALPGWARPIAGFAFDVALDPTTYVGAGLAAKAAKAGVVADEGISLAARHGGRQGLAKSIATRAAEAGVDNPTVDRLIAEAAQRGRGAITPRGMARAGVTDDLIEKLGLPTVGNTQLRAGTLRASVPGTARAAQALSDVKGVAMKALGETGGAKLYRQLRFSDDLGERAFMDVARGAGESASKRADAVRATAAINTARGASHKWLHDQVLKLGDEIPDLKKLDEGARRALVHEVESGGTSPMAQQVRQFLDNAFNDLTERGVDVAFRENYVPHTLSRAGRNLVSKSPELKSYFVNVLNSKERFQFARRLNAGDQFLGQTLETASIKEINDITRAKFGVELLDDDISSVIGNYVRQGAEAIKDTSMRQQLDDAVGSDVPRMTVRDKTNDVAGREAAASAASARAEQVGALKSSNQLRKQAAERGAEMVREAEAKVSLELDDLTKALDKGRLKAEEFGRRRQALEGRVASLTDAQAHWERIAKTAKGAERKAAQSRLRRIERKLGEVRTQVQRNVQSATSTSAKMETIASSLSKQRDQLRQVIDAKTEAEARVAAAKTAVGEGELPAEQSLRKVNARQQAAQAALDGATNDVDTAARTMSFMESDTAAVSGTLQRELDKMNEVLSDVGPSRGRGRPSRQSLMDERDWLRDRVSTIRSILDGTDDPWVESLARMEAQAAVHDMQALKAGRSAASFEDMAKSLKDPKFIQMAQEQAEEGFRKLSADRQIPEWMAKELTSKIEQMREPKFWDGLVKHYDDFMNWWKAWAVTSPGFVVRNAYSGAFNMYLDGVAIKESGNAWRKFYKIVEDNPQNYKEVALQRFKDPKMVEDLDQAYHAIAASGWGQAPEEVALKLVETKSSLNPLKADNVVTRNVRKLNEKAETMMRGTHAYDVIRRGGTMDQAADRIAMWHFNYRDITDFDRMAKRVMPFWTFYSRNMALQGQVWTKYPQRLNRSYFNAKRNIEGSSNPDEIVPSYFGEGGMIRLPFNLGGGTAYGAADLPSLRFIEDLDKASNPSRILADAGPIPKLAAELIAGKKLYTDQPFMDRMSRVERTPWGSEVRTPNESPGWAQIPGIRQLLEAAGLADTYEDGTPVMTDRTQYVVENLAPPLARSSKLIPNQEFQEDRQLANVLSFLGIGVRSNTQGAQDAELRRRQAIEAALAEKEKDLGR